MEKKMNYHNEYNKIPLPVLLNADFPSNTAWLSDGQRRLMEYVFDEYYKEIHEELKKCQECIEELEDEQRYLQDQSADLQHELNNLAGEK
tara:strand:- start:120 stop:389 length:270 start_codon:yes stop_codon:yes gene_type:complete